MAEPTSGPLGATVIRNMRRLRDARSWSAQQLSDRTARAGLRIPRSILANMENGRRQDVTVDELATLAATLSVDPWSLTTDDPQCVVCRNDPPAGYSCLTCERAGRADG